MKKPIEGEHWYFVDETGDPVFYDERGNLIIELDDGRQERVQVGDVRLRAV